MFYLRELRKTGVIVLACLILPAIAFAGGAVWELPVFINFWGAFWGFYLLSGIPALLFGAPIYTLLRVRHIANWGSALCAGLLPGGLLHFVHPSLGLLGMGVGAFVSLITHASFLRLPPLPVAPPVPWYFAKDANRFRR